jgi:hypothetical protein
MNEAAVWISADERRIPVKLSSKITFGTVVMELVDDERGIEAAAPKSRLPAG